MLLSHVLTEDQTVNVDDARAFVFAPVVTLLLVQPAAMRVLGVKTCVTPV